MFFGFIKKILLISCLLHCKTLLSIILKKNSDGDSSDITDIFKKSQELISSQNNLSLLLSTLNNTEISLSAPITLKHVEHRSCKIGVTP